MWSNSPDVQDAIADAQRAGAAAAASTQKEEEQQQIQDPGELTEDEVALAQDEASQGRSKDEIADIINRRRKGLANSR
jgi:hypothetical protein